jgi:hypothetical protein
VSFTIIEAEQRSTAWFAARAGRLTGSVAKDVLAKGKGKDEAVTRRDLRLRLVCERLTGQPQEDGFTNAAMQRGTDLEPIARGAYEAATGLMVRETGFLAHAEIMAGCSLDGDVDNFTGIVELKCPKSATHLRYLRNGTLPSEHLAQILHNLWISGAQWADFASFDDRFPPPLQFFCVRVHRDDFKGHLNLASYEIEARAFLTEVEREYKDVLSLQAVA